MSNICTIWEPSYEQKRDLGHITLKIVAHDEQKRDSGQITLKIVTGGGERRARRDSSTSAVCTLTCSDPFEHKRL